MRAVNLLPRETQSGSLRSVDPLLAGAAALTVVVVAAIGGGFALEHSHAASAQSRLATARAEVVRLQKESRQGAGSVTEPILPTPTVTGQKVPWTVAVDTALATRVAWDNVLSQLARVTPARVTVTSVTLGAATAGGTSGSLTLAGSAFTEDDVAQLLSRLALVPSFSDINLGTSTADPKSGVVTFSITAQVTGADTFAGSLGSAE